MAKKKLEQGNLLPAPKAKKNKTTKLRDLGRRKSKTSYQTRAQATAQKGYKRFDAELRLKEKAANERMRQLEKAGINSPAYQSVQAMLEILGKQTKGDRGRRFSETGKATYSEKEVLDKILNEFLYEQETSTLAGARKYQDEVWKSANANNKLSEAGISRTQWLDFWESMPDRKDRLYGSSEIVAMVRAYSIKNTTAQPEDRLTPQEIAEEIQASQNLKNAYAKLGLKASEVRAAKIKKRK